MPTYEYRCDTCGQEVEAIQSFTDPDLVDCPHCKTGRLRKLFGNVGVVFKGSGFYRNDARADAKKASDARTKKSGDQPAKKADSDTKTVTASGSVGDSASASKDSGAKQAAPKSSGDQKAAAATSSQRP